MEDKWKRTRSGIPERFKLVLLRVNFLNGTGERLYVSNYNIYKPATILEAGHYEFEVNGKNGSIFVIPEEFVHSWRYIE